MSLVRSQAKKKRPNVAAQLTFRNHERAFKLPKFLKPVLTQREVREGRGNVAWEVTLDVRRDIWV